MRMTADPSLDPADYQFHHDIRVRFAETDAMGIVHHSRYLPYLEEARVAWLRAIGHPYDELRAAGHDSAVLECFLQYRLPLRFDEVATIHLALHRVTRATFEIVYLVTVGDSVRATGATVHGTVTSSGRPTRLPSWIADMGASTLGDRTTTGA